MAKVIPGTKYYRYKEDGTLEVIRVNKWKGIDLYSVYDEENNFSQKTKDELDMMYTLLRPDGYITFMILNLENNIQDVAVFLHRKEDVDNNELAPFAVCRQFIDDVFTNMIIQAPFHACGVSISQETCPADVDFKYTMACNSIDYQIMVGVYMDDRIDTILSFINKKKFNYVLGSIANKNTNPQLFGLCETLEMLLKQNSFMYDFYRAFEIYPVALMLDPDTEGTFPYNPTCELQCIEQIVRKPIKTFYVTKFSKEIDLRAIQKGFVIIADLNDNLFLVAFDEEDSGDRVYEPYDYNAMVSQNKALRYHIPVKTN